MLKNSLIALCLSAGLTLILTGYADTYYKWVDDENVTHYSKHPPADRESTKIQTSGSRSAHPPTAVSRPATQDSQSSTQQVAAGTPIKNPEICKRARANLKTMQESARIRQKDEYGEVRLLSEEEKASEVNRAKVAIKENC